MRLLEPASEPPPAAAAPRRAQPEVNANVETFGALWGRVVNDYEVLLGEGPLDQQRFEAAVQYGGFSQFSMYDDPAVVEPIIDWQLATCGTGIA